MPIKPFYSELLMDHFHHPTHKHELLEANQTRHGINPGCGDQITLHLLVNDAGIIEDGSFTGDGCAISQASTDIMLEMIIGKDRIKALRLCSLFRKMTQGIASDSEIEELEEAGTLQDISHMPARIKCAVLSWHTLEEAFRSQPIIH